MGLLSVEGVVAGYSAADEVLKGVDLEVGPGEIVSVIGPNGAGKSTLLKVIAGVLAPSRGRVRLGDTPIEGRRPREISALGVAFVPQERNVFPTLSVRENLEMGGYLDPARARRRIEGIFGRFPLLAERRRHAARTLSGGQRQILAMAMALMVEPSLLLLDEPSAGLAPMAAERLFETIARHQPRRRGHRHGRAERAGGAGHRRARLHPGRRPQQPHRRGRRAGRRSRRAPHLPGRVTRRYDPR